jgi:hypothetical protein
MVMARFVGLGVSPAPFFLLFLFGDKVASYLFGGAVYPLNSLCLLRFIIIVLFSS